MVSFEEMIKSLELRDVLYKFLKYSHRAIKKQSGIDLDKMQEFVFKNVPPFDASNGFVALVLSLILWTISFYFIHFLVVQPVMKASRNSYTEYYHAMSPKGKLYYSSYYLGIFHALISFVGSVYCFIYADGEPETTWFHCNWYKLNMFDVQKYFNMLSIGYLLFQLGLCNYV